MSLRKNEDSVSRDQATKGKTETHPLGQRETCSDSLFPQACVSMGAILVKIVRKEQGGSEVGPVHRERMYGGKE